MTTASVTTKTTTTAMAAQDVRPGRLIVEPDGRMRRVRDVKYGCDTVVLVYTAGPSDVYRRTYMLDVVPVPDRPAWDTTVYNTVGARP